MTAGLMTLDIGRVNKDEFAELLARAVPGGVSSMECVIYMIMLRA